MPIQGLQLAVASRSLLIEQCITFGTVTEPEINSLNQLHSARSRDRVPRSGRRFMGIIARVSGDNRRKRQKRKTKTHAESMALSHLTPQT
jgi:hypothetical protein